jgi:hypothetical protein
MKYRSVTFALAALAAISAPLAAQGNGGKYGRNNNGVYDRNGDGVIDRRDQVNSNGCSWWDINCTNSRSTRTTNSRSGIYDDSGWYQVGRDSRGDLVYERRIRDRNGNVVVQTAWQDRKGHLHIVNGKGRGLNNRINGRYDTQINGRGDDNDDDDRFDDRGEGRGRGRGHEGGDRDHEGGDRDR